MMSWLQRGPRARKKGQRWIHDLLLTQCCEDSSCCCLAAISSTLNEKKVHLKLMSDIKERLYKLDEEKDHITHLRVVTHNGVVKQYTMVNLI